MSGFWNDSGDWLIIVRAIHFASTAVIVGILIFRVAVGEPAWREAASALDIQVLRIAWISLLVSAVSGIAWVLLEAPIMSGLPFGEAMASDVIGTVVTETQFGLVSQVRLALATVLAACLASERLPGVRWVALASALALIASIAWTGHAGSTAGELGVFHLAADALHLLAAAAWIGGLISLALLLVAVPRHQPHHWQSLAKEAALRFSMVGVLSVATLSLTGIFSAWILVGSFGALFATGYGRLLMLKISLFAIMLAFAAVNRFWLTPGLADFSSSKRARDVARTLVRNCAIEIALGIAIFAIVGALGTMHPASHLDSASMNGSR
jgi:putative copper resistance protein D